MDWEVHWGLSDLDHLTHGHLGRDSYDTSGPRVPKAWPVGSCLGLGGLGPQEKSRDVPPGVALLTHQQGVSSPKEVDPGSFSEQVLSSNHGSAQGNPQKERCLYGALLRRSISQKEFNTVDGRNPAPL